MYLVNFYGVFLTKKFDQVNVFNLVFVGVFYQLRLSRTGNKNRRGNFRWKNEAGRRFKITAKKPGCYHFKKIIESNVRY